MKKLWYVVVLGFVVGVFAGAYADAPGSSEPGTVVSEAPSVASPTPGDETSVSESLPSVTSESPSDDEDPEVEPDITIGDACIYPGTFQCRCGDAHMGCQTKNKCLSYCLFDD